MVAVLHSFLMKRVKYLKSQQQRHPFLDDLFKINLFQLYTFTASFAVHLLQQMMAGTPFTSTDGRLAPHSGD